MVYVKPLLLSLFALSASAAQTPKPPPPVHADVLQAVRLHAAALRSEPIRLNSDALHPFRAKPLFAESPLPPVAMTSQDRPASSIEVAGPMK